MPFKRLTRERDRPLRDAMLLALRSAMLIGQLPAGTRLSESEIAHSMRVSRSPVREAVAHREQDGTIIRKHISITPAQLVNN